MINVSSANVFEILRTVARASRPLGIKEISLKLGLPPSTTHRCVVTLMETGYLARHQLSTSYVLGDAADHLRRSFFLRYPIRHACMPFLQQLAFMTGETVHLSVPIGWYSVVIASVAGSKDTLSSRQIGSVSYLNADADSKVILAFFPDERVRAFAEWRAATEPGLNLVQLLDTLQYIRMARFAMGRDLVSGHAAISMPVTFEGQAVASVTIDGPVLMTGHSAQNPELTRWQSVIAEIEKVVAQAPDAFREPFAHLDPASIHLDVTP